MKLINYLPWIACGYVAHIDKFVCSKSRLWHQYKCLVLGSGLSRPLFCVAVFALWRMAGLWMRMITAVAVIKCLSFSATFQPLVRSELGLFLILLGGLQFYVTFLNFILCGLILLARLLENLLLLFYHCFILNYPVSRPISVFQIFMKRCLFP